MSEIAEVWAKFQALAKSEGYTVKVPGVNAFRKKKLEGGRMQIIRLDGLADDGTPKIVRVSA